MNKMNDREKYEFELLENRIYKLERLLLLASNRLEVIETILETIDDISAGFSSGFSSGFN